MNRSLIQFGVELSGKATLNVGIQYPDAEAADEAQKSVKGLLASFRQTLASEKQAAEEGLLNPRPNANERSALMDLPQAFGQLMILGLTNRAEGIVKDLAIKRVGNALTTTVDIPAPEMRTVATAASAIGLLLPAVQKVREAAARVKDQNNLKQIVLALHNYASAYGKLPPAAICDKNGKPLLSWRVAILPFIEQQNLYQQFHLDEPWDSEHNIKLAQQLPPVYRHPIDVPKPGEKQTTRYVALVGNGAGWELDRGLNFASDFPDGLSNTIFVVESTKPVVWTKPEDIEYDPKKMPPLDFGWNGQYCNVAFCDGSVRSLSKRVPEKTWHLLIQRADGQAIPPGDLDK